jgi:hypothetical protein
MCHQLIERMEKDMNMQAPVKPMRPLNADDLYRHLQTLDSVQAYQFGKDYGAEAGWMEGVEWGRELEYNRGWWHGLGSGALFVAIVFAAVIFAIITGLRN